MPDVQKTEIEPTETKPQVSKTLSAATDAQKASKEKSYSQIFQ
jgi:hypothetical protein